MPCSRTQHGDACGDRTQDLSIRSPTLYHYATALPMAKYEIPDIDSICELDISKDQWKIKTKNAVRKYWTERLRQEADEKSTLHDVRRGVVKCGILTGTYTVQTIRSKFNQYQVNSTCPLCFKENEDIIHMLLRCSVLHSVRKESFRVLKDYIISKTDPVFPTKTSLTKLIIDCGQITELQTVRGIDLSTVERLTKSVFFCALRDT